VTKSYAGQLTRRRIGRRPGLVARVHDRSAVSFPWIQTGQGQREPGFEAEKRKGRMSLA
jgi:hypothetical protein